VVKVLAVDDFDAAGSDAPTETVAVLRVRVLSSELVAWVGQIGRIVLPVRAASEGRPVLPGVGTLRRGRLAEWDAGREDGLVGALLSQTAWEAKGQAAAAASGGPSEAAGRLSSPRLVLVARGGIEGMPDVSSDTSVLESLRPSQRDEL